MPRRLSVGNSLLLHVRLGVGRLPSVCAMVLLAALAGCKGERLGSKDKEPRQKARPAAKGPAASNPEVLTPKVAWRTPFTGRVEPLVLLGEVLIVSSRQRGDRAAGRRLAGFSTTDGRMLWQRPLRLRYFDPGATFSTSHAAVGGVLAVALSAGRVEGLDPRTGAKLWQLRADGGVVAAGDYFAISRSDEVLLVGPKDGKTVKLQRLDEVASGAPGNGLMDAMPKGARLGAAPGVIHFPRRHGGALQVMDAVTLAGRWLLGPDGALADRPARLAATRSTLLLPRLFPKAQVNTQIRVLRTDPREISGAGATSRWEVTVPGRVTAKRLFVTADKVIALSRSSNRQTLLVRVDRAKGTLLDARPFPTPHFCFLGEGLLACQREKEIRALDLETLATRWRYEPGPSTTIHQVRRAGGSLVIEVGSQLLVKRLADGRVTLDQPRLLERHPYRVVAALGEADGRLVMAVRHLEGSPWGDRLVLLGLDLGTGKPAYAHRIWRFPRPEAARPGAVQEDEKLPGQLPMLWIGPGRGGAAKVLTLFEKTMQLVEAASGRALLARGLPGEEGKPVRLLGEEGGVALWQRGTTLFAIALPEAKLLWQASLFRARLERGLASRALISRAGPKGRLLELVPPIAPDPLAPGRAFVERDGCALRQGLDSLWLCQGEANLLVLDAREGKVLERMPRAAHVAWDGELLITTHPGKERSAGLGAWIGVDLASGKERWRQQEPAGQGPRPAAALPPPYGEEQARPARWSEAAEGIFLVTDEAGRCVHGVVEETGKEAFRACFGSLGGPPAVFEGKLLLTAAPAGAQGKAGPGAAGQGQALFLLDPATGSARLLQAPEPQKSLVLGSAGSRGNRVFLGSHPTRGSFTHNEVLALDLR